MKDETMKGKMDSTKTETDRGLTVKRRLAVSSPVGTEHEYSINDRDHRPLAISDRIIERIAGEV